MLSVEDARRLVDQHAIPPPPRLVALAEATGLVLAEDVRADGDSPPFDKSLVDGYAVRADDLITDASVELEVIEEVPAGSVPTRPIGPNQATAIMTGAPLPSGANAVIMVERALATRPGRAVLRGPVKVGQDRLARGREYREGTVLLAAGARLTPARVGLLAAAGRAQVRVVPAPTVAVVSTGDELVNANEALKPGQVRDSNAPMLRALVAEAGGQLLPISPIGRDRTEDLRALFQGAFDAGADVLVISGGVSAGTKDLVPGTLEGLDVAPVFHKVRLRPGKPLWFGVGPRGQLVFGLPGNPVSGLVGVLLFVAPALRALKGLPSPEQGPKVRPARLATPFHHRGDRPTYHPARVEDGHKAEAKVAPLPWAGSPDLFTVTQADGFLHFPEGDRKYREGERVDFLPM